ncbi:MAG: 50S ribosomal protein L9 [Verrucomicrobia bacterium]|jgi:large subunit ribosomal protein L9|nr:50S ribosomal protein L9 [Verrucomicrobiota bacterium]
MANAELLLLEPIEDLGNEGDTVSVAAGYARNYLLPRGKAIPVTRANRKQIESLRTRSEKRRASELEAAEAIKGKLEAMSIVFAVKTGPGGKMFGAITAQDLIDRIGEEGVDLEKKQVSLYNPVKSLGKHTTRIRLHPEVAVDFDFEVVSENPIEEENEEAGTQGA